MNTMTATAAAPINLHDFTRGVSIRSDVAARLSRPLSDDQLRQRAPSIFADRPWEGMSERYEFIPTARIVTSMRDAGFEPVEASQSSARIEGKGDFTKHMIRFRPAGMQTMFVGDTIAEIALVNSHDGASGFQLRAALRRLACNNGLMVSSGEVGEIRVRHTGRILDDVIEGTGTLIREVPKVGGLIERMHGLRLDQEQRIVFANAAIALRYDDAGHCPVAPHSMLAPRRAEDKGPDLWTTYNIIQEAILRGGVRGRNATGKRYTTREVNSVGENVRLNTGLWQLAEEALDILA